MNSKNYAIPLNNDEKYKVTYPPFTNELKTMKCLQLTENIITALVHPCQGKNRR